MKRFPILVIAGMSAALAFQPPEPGEPKAKAAIEQPRVVYKTDPKYSEEARRARVNAAALLNLIVSTDGTPQKIRVLNGPGFGLDELAIDAVRTWRFEPGTKNGKPVAVYADVRVNFSMPGLKKRLHQQVRLNFTLPPNTQRPELMQGMMPENPPGDDPYKFRAELTVGKDGKARNISILSATNGKWDNGVEQQIKKWLFLPAAFNGQSVEVTGVLEISRGFPLERPKQMPPSPAAPPTR